MNKRFADAIRRVGGSARLPGGSTFPASIQPRNVAGDGHGETGEGLTHRYTLFAPVCPESEKLRDGGELRMEDRLYLVESIETIYLNGAPLYRRGTLVLTQKGDYIE